MLNLIDEAFSSSALEGAITTHHEARDLIANQRPSANSYQRMVSHATLNAVSYQTSRKDLLALEKPGLLLGSKDGKERVFVAPANLRQNMVS